MGKLTPVGAQTVPNVFLFSTLITLVAEPARAENVQGGNGISAKATKNALTGGYGVTGLELRLNV